MSSEMSEDWKIFLLNFKPNFVISICLPRTFGLLIDNLLKIFDTFIIYRWIILQTPRTPQSNLYYQKTATNLLLEPIQLIKFNRAKSTLSLNLVFVKFYPRPLKRILKNNFEYAACVWITTKENFQQIYARFKTFKHIHQNRKSYFA